jgi:segregation and condensation protein B
LERQLVRLVGRKDIAGKPFLYGTTREFLELFNLKDLTELPTLKEMDEIALPEVPDQDVLPVEDEGEAVKGED